VGLTFVVGKGRIWVERDPALCGRLNEEVGHPYGVAEPRDKSCVSCVLAHCVCSSSSFSHHSVEELFISFWCVDFEKCPSQIYYFEPCGSSRTSHCKVNWVLTPVNFEIPCGSTTLNHVNFEINSVLYLIL
jgi:hypothetical protein